MKRETLLLNPLTQFERWYDEAKAKNEDDLDAMTLATINSQGEPSARIVLYKGLVENGFAIYTNYTSVKAKEMDANPFAALVFYWPKSYRQVRVEGRVEKLSYEASNKYFQTRPRDSQLGAWASMQSKAIETRQELINRYEEVKTRFGEGLIPCPEFWGGYALMPNRIEFWQGRPARLHDRFVYVREGDNWEIKRLAP